MNIIIFAGGAGTRLWPLSRKHSPKQFEILHGDKSTLQMCVERVANFGYDNMYISTNERYREFIREQAPDIPEEHIFVEPAKRDLAAAVGLTLTRLKRRGVSGTVAILWSDHFMEHHGAFEDALKKGEALIKKDKERFVFLGETPRFANHNLGWIHVGKESEGGQHEFLGWKYRPDVSECEEMFSSGEWLWNPGYFVFDIDFVLSLYEKHMPEMLQKLQDMVGDEALVAAQYPTLEALNFDKAIVEKIDPSQAVVLKVDLGWSDPGTLYALKEALTDTREENYVKGNVVLENTEDCLVYNGEKEKLVATVGLEGLVVVNTPDALLVCAKDAVPNIKELLDNMEAQGLSKHL